MKRIDIFKKKFLFMPIGGNSHWTLCVIVNAGGLLNKLQSSNNVSFMLFLDSKEGLHNFDIVASTVRKWLNYSAHQNYRKKIANKSNFLQKQHWKRFPQKVCAAINILFNYHAPIFFITFSFSSCSREWYWLWCVCVSVCLQCYAFTWGTFYWWRLGQKV